MLDDIFSDNAVLSGTTSTQSPEEVLILCRVGDEDISRSGSDAHLQNLC